LYPGLGKNSVCPERVFVIETVDPFRPGGMGTELGDGETRAQTHDFSAQPLRPRNCNRFFVKN
jgi:hypothetical protein